MSGSSVPSNSSRSGTRRPRSPVEDTSTAAAATAVGDELSPALSAPEAGRGVKRQRTRRWDQQRTPSPPPSSSSSGSAAAVGGAVDLAPPHGLGDARAADPVIAAAPPVPSPPAASAAAPSAVNPSAADNRATAERPRSELSPPESVVPSSEAVSAPASATAPPSAPSPTTA